MEPRDATYESLRETVASLSRASGPRDRRLAWATSERLLALARDPDGRIEVFVLGDPLEAGVKSVADVLEHQTWIDDDGHSFAANRLVLPHGEHFDHLGALLCVELMEHRVEDDAQSAFSAVEPLIALALTREMLTDLTLMGLLGELAFLEALLHAATPASAIQLLNSWAGSAPSARDFQIGRVGVEVKTTQGGASIHHVEGVHQVELGRANDGRAETSLFLLSLGIGWVVDKHQGRALPELVNSILAHLTDPDARADFLVRVRQYGGDAALGYDHARDRNKPRYVTRVYFRFERLYDMTDERLRLLTSSHLAELPNVDPGSVKFRVVLADRVRGEVNPSVGWDSLVNQVLEAAGVQRR